jgi:ADP-L-glycero-D-manno-heptose 6-epimerase|tara:strand:+ start:1150 stop:1953 length:804 start_codon:yes stop_codon:yes gene_type:complete
MIIVTGSQGFIGRHFLNTLQDQGKDIIEVDQQGAWYFKSNFDKWDQVELIIHQGAISDTTYTNLKALFSWNIEYSEWLFGEAIKYQIPIKYASSASVYGLQKDIINPLNYYALSKVTLEYWIQDHIDEFKLMQAFRYFNVYGTGEDHKGDQASPVSKFTKQIKEDNKLKLFEGSDKFLRDFVCVDDVLDIVLNNDKPTGFYDLGTSEPVSFKQVAEWVVDKYGGEIEEVPFPDHLKGKYQEYTCAKKEWGDYKFKTIPEYLEGLPAS